MTLPQQTSSLLPIPGTRVGEWYRVEGMLGTGSFGAVLRATDDRSGRRVALKFSLRRHAEHRQLIRLRNLEHPNLVKMLEYIEDPTFSIAVMEFVPGPTIVEYVRSSADLAKVEAGFRCVFGQLVNAVSQLHERGIIHRDIKPSNVLVTAQDRVVVLDFGLAAEMGQVDPAETAGTLAYMPPEQLWGAPPSPAADYYSVGVMMFEALTGELPFGGHPVELLEQKRQLSESLVAERLPPVPNAIRSVIASLLNADPAKRPGPYEIAEALNAADSRARHGDPVMPHVQWEGMPWETYERLVAVLLSVMNPLVRRVDGRGGDEGRDLHFSDNAGLHVYELKSFTGRMDGRRRRQVERSLKRAKALTPIPSSWDLVVPIDPTPNELRWFHSLASAAPFPLDWKGRTWLDARIAEYPVVRRSVLEGGADEAMRLPREANQEAAALGRGAPDAIERVQRILARLNESDAYYVFDIAADASGSWKVGVKTRYKGADLERPITGHFALEFPDTPAGHEARRRFADSLKFGEGVELEGSFIKSFHLNAPAGLGGDFSDAVSLALTPVGSADWKRQVRLLAVAANGTILAELPIWLNHRTRGTSGAVLSGADRTGGLRVQMRIDLADPKGGELRMSFTMPEDAFPEDISPVFDLISYLRSPNQLVLADADTGFHLGSLTEFADLEVDEVFGALVARLARLQRETRRRFPFPAVLTREDQEELALAEHFLNGGSLPHNWTSAQVASTPAKVLAAREVIEQNQCLTAEFDGEYAFELAGMRVSLPARIRLESARISGTEALRTAETANDPETVISLDFVPGESDKGEIFLRR